MTSDEEDEEEDYEDENDQEDEGTDLRANGSGESGGDAEEEDAPGEGASDEDEDDNEDDEDEDEDEDDDDEDDDDDDDEDEDERSDEQENGDVEMANGDEEAGSPHPSQTDQDKTHPSLPLPTPAHIIRRGLFVPSYSTPPNTLSIETIVAIPLPAPVHSIASTLCSSYLLTGSQEGHIRAYDFWASVNGGQVMTTQQRTIVGLGEGVSKAGVGRGWWSNEVEGLREGAVGKRLEPVYSLACEGDGLWALAGTQSGPINLFTLRHSPGHLVHSLKGHTNVVSCISLLPSEKGLLSGSWDGSLREWDLNTGQTVRTYPTHGAQLSSIALRPFAHPPSPSPSRNQDEQVEQEDADGREQMAISIGPDFDQRRDTPVTGDGEQLEAANVNGTATPSENQADPALIPAKDADVQMSDQASPYDPLFDDDAEGEEVLEVPASTEPPAINDMNPPSPRKSKPPALALPGTVAQSSESTPLFPAAQLASSSRQGAASNIPLLSPTSYKSFSEDVLLTSSMDGQVVLIDRRVPVYDGSSGGVGRLLPGDRAPPWCMSACWSGDGTQVLAGRRNGTIDIWDVRRHSTSTSPNLLRTLRTPTESGPVSCVVAFPDGRHVATASQDNIRLWNTAEYFEPDDSAKRSRSRPPFKIIAGHHGGIISSMIVDPTCRFLITASGDRGWQGESTRVVLIHDIKWS